MSPENRKRVQEAVSKAGDELRDSLPPLSSHPEGRNSYAHIWHGIKEHFGRSYKDVDDEDLNEMLFLIEELRKNPS